ARSARRRAAPRGPRHLRARTAPGASKRRWASAARDDRVVERPEELVVQAPDVLSERLARRVELGLRRQLDLVEALLGGRLVEEARLDLAEAGLLGEQREGLRDERLRVRQVGEVVPERDRRERVDRLGDEDAACAQLRVRELEQP